ncbi:MAG: PTS sugar transporter subunit IIA [Deltaproteobacteria bacterium]|nr:PTS sugar transporter subunit IIA [Deltaproteobacteria bacterium]
MDINLDQILSPQSVQLNFEARNKEELLQNLSAAAAAELGAEQPPILSALRSREALGSTALGNGIMAPHGKLAFLKSLHLHLFRLAPDCRLEYDTPDGLPVRLIALILSPPEPGPDYLKLLAAIGRIWGVSNNVKALMECQDKQTFRQTFIYLTSSLVRLD